MKHTYPHSSIKQSHYHHLGIMLALSFASMFLLMYAMVNTVGNVYTNLNQLYMAGLMTGAMLMIELCVMRAMYPKKKLNVVIMLAGVVVLLSCWLAIRQQIAISDRQFLKSMIPHHASAILMCENAALDDPAVKTLCEAIIFNQQAEIDLMKAKLAELEK